MPVPSSINDLSTTAASNYPAGSETPAEGDNHHRQAYSFIATLRDWFNGTSPANITVANLTANGNIALGDGSGDTMSVAPSAVSWTNNPTHSGNHTFSGNTVLGTSTSGTVTTAGNVTIAAPASGYWLTLAGSGATINFSDTGSTVQQINMRSSTFNELVSRTAGGGWKLYCGAGVISTTWSSAGNVTIAAPSSGYGLNIPTGTPASAAATGTTGDICWDGSYIYVCTATNTWKRAGLSTW